MTDSSQGGTIAATFTDKPSADACVDDLKENGFASLWMAVTPATAAGRPEHAIAESSDGALGRIGRYLSGAHSLRQALVEHGVGEDEAERIDASLALSGAVIVVDPGDRAELATEIFRRSASRVFAPGSETGGRYPSTTDTVPGQADELDRGSGRCFWRRLRRNHGIYGRYRCPQRHARERQRNDRIEIVPLPAVPEPSLPTRFVTAERRTRAKRETGSG